MVRLKHCLTYVLAYTVLCNIIWEDRRFKKPSDIIFPFCFVFSEVLTFYLRLYFLLTAATEVEGECTQL